MVGRPGLTPRREGFKELSSFNYGDSAILSCSVQFNGFILMTLDL